MEDFEADRHVPGTIAHTVEKDGCLLVCDGRYLIILVEADAYSVIGGSDHQPG